MMKRKVLFLGLVGSLFYLVIINGHSSPQKWAGSIETKDGVKIISNPDQPVFGDVRYDLEEVWVLGKEKNENDLFASIYDVQVDAQGNIYVSDIRDRRVKKFNAEGKYLRNIGRMGQGPGEFQGARNLAVDDLSGDIYLADLLKVHRYDRECAYQNSIPINGFFENFYVDKEGAFWARMSYFDEKTGQGKAFDKISSHGELIKRITKLSASDTGSLRRGAKDSVTVTSGPKHGYEPELLVSRVDGQTFLWAVSNEYALNMIDTQGNLSFKILKKEEPQPFSNQEKDKILNGFRADVRAKIELPKFKPFLKKVFADSEGRIYVQKVRSPLDEKEDYPCDIFSKEGYYLYRVRFDVEPAVIKNGFLYSVVRDRESSYQLVKKYRIKNWDRIEKRIPG
jgi:hypothetical protein